MNDLTASSDTPGLDSGAHDRPNRIGRLWLLRELGAGGMGVVYAAYDPELDRKVALKMLHPTRATSVETRARLLREAQALAKLAHPNVVPVYDFGVHEHQVWLSMEFIKGSTVAAWARREARSWREIVDVFKQAVQGVEAAHRAGLLHRDLKPANIMIGEDGRVRVMDFGLARSEPSGSLADEPYEIERRSAFSATLTLSGTVVGTPAYMAPEQLLGLTSDERTDQFSLCVAFWEALYGQRPFPQASPALRLAAMMAGQKTPPPPGHAGPGWIHRIVERGLAPRREDRFADMSALLSALASDPTPRRWLLGLGVGVVALGALYVVVTQSLHARAVSACTAAGAVIAADWNDEARDRFKQAALVSGKQYAPTVHDRTVPWLDRWADGWFAARSELCVRHDIDASWDDATYLRGLDCLDEARANFAALIQVLGDPAVSPLSGATTAAAGLPSVDACLQATQVARRPLPSVERLAEIAGLRRRLARVASLNTAGSYPEGFAAAQEADAAARALGWGSSLAEAKYRLAQSAEHVGRLELATAGFEEALRIAASARDSEWTIESAIALIRVVGSLRGHFSEARVWGSLAEVQLAQLPGEHLGLTANYYQNLGSVLHDSGAYAEARALFEQNLALTERRVGADHPDYANGLEGIANVHYVLGEYEEARAAYERSIAIFEQALGPEHPRLVPSLFGLGSVNNVLGANDRALQLMTRALALAEQTQAADSLQVTALLMGIGVVQGALGNYEEAIRLLQRALVLQETSLGPYHPHVAMSLTNLAAMNDALGRHREAIGPLKRALTIQMRTDGGRDHPDTAIMLSNLGDAYRACGMPAESREHYVRALEIQERELPPGHDDLASPLFGLGMLALAEGHLPEAVLRLERALAVREKHSVEPTLRAEVRFALARALDAEGTRAQRDRALALAIQAQEEFAAASGQATRHAEVQAWVAGRVQPEGTEPAGR